MLGEKNIAYVLFEVDALSEQEQKEALAAMEGLTGRRAFPVIVVNEKVIQGYKPEEIGEALQDES